MTVTNVNRSFNAHHISRDLGNGGDDIAALQAAIDLVESLGGGIVQVGQVPTYRASGLLLGNNVVLDLGGSTLEATAAEIQVSSRSYSVDVTVESGNASATTSTQVPVGAVLGLPTTGDKQVATVASVDGTAVTLSEPSTVTGTFAVEYGAVRCGVQHGVIDCLGISDQGVQLRTASFSTIRHVMVANAANVAFSLVHGSRFNTLVGLKAVNPFRHGVNVFRGSSLNTLTDISVVASQLEGHGVIIDDRTSGVNEWDGVCYGNRIDGLAVDLDIDTAGTAALFVNGVRNVASNIVARRTRLAVMFAFGVANQAPQRQSGFNAVSSVSYRTDSSGNALQFQDGTTNNAASGVAVEGGTRGVLIQGGTGHVVSAMTIAGVSGSAIDVLAAASNCAFAAVSTGGAAVSDAGTGTQLVAIT